MQIKVNVNGVALLIKDVKKRKQQEIKQEYDKNHEKLEAKVKKTDEYKKLQKRMDRLTRHLGEAWNSGEQAVERLQEEFVKVRIEVMSK